MARFTVLLLLIAAAAASAGAVDTMERPKRDEVPSYSETHGYLSSREELLATRDHRKNQYADKVQQWKEQLSSHADGSGRRLSEGEHLNIQRKIRAYETKLERHMNHDLDNRDVDRLLAREEIRASRNWERQRSRGREL
jgi:hypothetical protein